MSGGDQASSGNLQRVPLTTRSQNEQVRADSGPIRNSLVVATERVWRGGRQKQFQIPPQLGRYSPSIVARHKEDAT